MLQIDTMMMTIKAGIHYLRNKMFAILRGKTRIYNYLIGVCRIVYYNIELIHNYDEFCYFIM
jgi:hypothetical protein